mmetsp:Transcript_53988/g.171305  ORF Transcript_53988/g.171305 Transcript_53988/m.171305 type:complete len:216 (-) Transcript_53988:431-1078(-)
MDAFTSAAAAGAPPAEAGASTSMLSSSPAWLKIQSAARSRLLSVALRALRTAGRSKPIDMSIATLSSSGGAAPPPAPPAGAEGSAPKVGSSILAMRSSIAASTPALLVSTAAASHRARSKPMLSSCMTIAKSAAGLAGAAAASSGRSSSPSCRPAPRRAEKSTVSGTSTFTSSFLGTQLPSSTVNLRMCTTRLSGNVARRLVVTAVPMPPVAGLL